MTRQLTRRERVRQDTIEEIMRIAREEMQRDGVAALSLGAIARALGMRTPSLYTYFDSKNAIYDELFRRGFAEFGQWVEERPSRHGPLRANLISAMNTYMRFAQTNPDLYQLMFQRPVPGFTPSAESMAVSLDKLEKMRMEMDAVLRSNQLETGLPVAEAGDLFLGMQHGLTELHLANNPELEVGDGRFGKLVEQAVDLFLAAWQKR
jgi:AcrR family transcriptional regulator